ncbi:MAG TPA: hypothetical protein EYG38_00825, partial [Verrucomicrobia bacterium]|nr:hypothetical protein [Verrucomicrobiota bacterium]
MEIPTRNLVKRLPNILASPIRKTYRFLLPIQDISKQPIMPTIKPSQAAQEYDVAIIGSGAGGGQMAYTLTLAGLKCVMLESG